MAEIQISLKAARVNAELTQAEAGKAIGVRQETIGEWENGMRDIPYQKFAKLAELYKIPMQNIFLPRNLTKSEKEG